MTNSNRVSLVFVVSTGAEGVGEVVAEVGPVLLEHKGEMEGEQGGNGGLDGEVDNEVTQVGNLGHSDPVVDEEANNLDDGANHVDLEEELASLSGVVFQLQDECDGASKGKGESNDESNPSIGSEVVEGGDEAKNGEPSENLGTEVVVDAAAAEHSCSFKK